MSGQQFPKNGHILLLHRHCSEDTKHDASKQQDVKPAVRQGAKCKIESMKITYAIQLCESYKCINKSLKSEKAMTTLPNYLST